MQDGHEKMRGPAARSSAGVALTQLYQEHQEGLQSSCQMKSAWPAWQEVVTVIGRAITKDPRVKDGAERAQQYGARQGGGQRVTQLKPIRGHSLSFHNFF